MTHRVIYTPTPNDVHVTGAEYHLPILDVAVIDALVEDDFVTAGDVWYDSSDSDSVFPEPFSHHYAGWEVEFTPEQQAARLAAIIAQKREALRAEINTERDKREQGGFAYLGAVVESDPVSCQRIAVAHATAMMALTYSVPYEVIWSCADNTLLTLDAMGVVGMMQALGNWGLQIHYASRAKKDEVDALTTIAQFDAYDITTGWQG